VNMFLWCERFSLVAIAMLQMREESERRDTSQEKERERAFQRQRKCEDRRREVLQGWDSNWFRGVSITLKLSGEPAIQLQHG